jgi:hypothetical protein
MKGTYEIKSKATGKVVYSASADDVAADWNYKKKRLIMGFSTEKKLIEHKLGFQDLVFTLPEEKITIAEGRIKHDKEAKERLKSDAEGLMKTIKSEIKKPVVRRKKK